MIYRHKLRKQREVEKLREYELENEDTFFVTQKEIV